MSLPTDLPLTVSTLLRPTLAVRLFGQRQLSFADQPLRFGAPVRALSLLAYLLLHREKTLARDALAYTLWPDERETDARANLRRHLYLLQNEVLPRTDGVTWILTDARAVQWNPEAPLWLDVAEFERLVGEDGTAAAAAELYHGDLLADLEDEWVERRRAQYRGQFCELLLSLAQARRARGDLSAGLGYVKILLQHDGWREDALRLFMELRHQSGDRVSALREYRDFERRLKEEMGAEPMPETLRLYEHIAAATEPIAAASASSATEGTRNNLPLQVTTLHGRDRELAEIVALIERTNVVTLCGSAGVGKTRAAVEAAGACYKSFPAGAWFVEFAAISEASLIAPTLAAVLSVRASEEQSLDDIIIETLRGRALLLVLDNCEHLVEEIAKLVYRIVRACAAVRIVATSREPLRVAGERVYRIAPLALPEIPQGRPPSIEELRESPAIQLFLERAAAAEPDFQLETTDCPAVLAICRRLDGIPLAIELAAARLRIMSVRALAQGLDDRFRLLTGGDRTALPRQQTLRALIDWSYNLLSERERRLLHRLGIFAGRFTLEAATAVGANDESDKLLVLDLLSALVEKSLVIAETRDDRYRLLESTGEYACEQLRASGEHDAIAARHAAFYADAAKVIDDLYWTIPTADWLKTVAAEAENFLEAMRWAFESAHDYVTGGRIAAWLVRFWRVSPFGLEGVRYIQRALACVPPEETTLLAQLWLASAQVRERPPREAAQRALDLYRETGNETGIGLSQQIYAKALAYEQCHDEADLALQEAIAIFRRLNRPRMLARAHEMHSIALSGRGDFVGALTSADRARTIYEQLEDDVQIGIQFARTAECTFLLRQDAVESLLIARRGYALYGVHEDTRRASIWCVANLAAYALLAGEYDEARRFALDALLLARDTGFEQVANHCVEHLASVSAARGQCSRAARLTGYAARVFRDADTQRGATEQLCYEALLARLRDALAPGELLRLLEEGSVLDRASAIREAASV